ncbi:MAG: heat shock protein transcriptional repressor HspR [Mycobacteriales bacterium]
MEPGHAGERMEMPGARPAADRGVFAISVAAELVGLHPQTLRLYEREGLLEPTRSSGGTRLYSQRDVERLQEIATLTEAGLNLVGVRRVLELEHETRRLQAEVAALRHKLQKARRSAAR